MGVNLIDNQYNTDNVSYGYSGKKDTDFIQYGIRDVSAGIIESLLGAAYDTSKSYILKGCVLTSSGGITSISGGYIYGIAKVLGSMLNRTYIYSVAPQSFADPVGPDVVVAKVTAFPQSYDPTLFTDSSTHNIHNEWRVVFSAGASGSGDVDYSDLLTPILFNTSGLALLTGWTNVAAPYYPAGYKIYNGNHVALCGAVTKSVFTAPIDVLQLPFTLTEQVAFATILDDSTPSLQMIRVLIDTSGKMTIDGSTAGTATLYLDGMSFRIS